MKRELAFALKVQSQLPGSLGRTRASKVHNQSGDLSGVTEVRDRKRLRGSVANESELNCEDVRKVRGRQFNGTAVYRRTRRSKNAADWEEEQKVSVAERIEAAVEEKSKGNLVTPCEDESKGDLAEASIKLEELRDGNENSTANDVDSEVVAMAVDKSNGVRNGESDEVKSDGIIEVRSDVPDECMRSALNSTPKVEVGESSVSVVPGSGFMDGGENESVVLNVEVNGSPDVSALVTPTRKLELKMSKKISMGRTPRTVKELFATGLLEGYSVFYNGGNKGFALQGMIKDVGILCFCSSCNGSQVVNPCQFEIHACKSYRRAAQYICLENGKSLLEVVKACRSSHLDTLEETIHSVIGKLPEKESIVCQNCKGSFLATFAEKVKQLCESCAESNNLEATPADVKQHCEPCLESKNLEATPIDTIDANDRFLKPDLALRRSTRTQCILAQDESQGSIRDDRSPELVVMAKSPASGSAPILSQRQSQEKTIRKSLKPSSAPMSSGSASVPICSRNKCQVRIGQNYFSRSRSASVSKPSASTLMRISSTSTRQGKITKKLPKLVSARKSYRGASVHILSESKRQRKMTKRSSKADLSTRSSRSASQCTSSAQKSKWKITKKDLRLHKLVFEEDGLPEGTEVAYYSNGQKLLEGYKRGLGILCHCCNSEVSASQFEAHAGWASRRKPYSYIYTLNGVSLHEFAISLLRGRKHCAKDNDDLCIICADGGNLVLCDGCPRAFHTECAALSSIPRGKWYCNYCQNMFLREKFVERNANAVAAGRVSGVDPIEQITKRCMRIVKNPEDAEVIACVLCRGYDFSKSGFGPRTVIVCDQCEKEYHVGCLKKYKMADLKELPKGTWFCCMDCGKIYSALHNLLVRGEEKIPDSLLDVIRKKHEDKASNAVTDFDVRWRLLSGKIASPETRSLLSKAVAIFHECFDPIVDFATGRDFIPSMVYGRNIRGQDFGGMYCAILTVNSSVVSAGIFRVFGREIAELPLVATSNGNQGKGYFQLLFSCIEKLFAFLNVKSLVLPAADEAESIWTNKFGFEKIPPEQLSKYRKTCWQMLTFKGTSMLQKMVPQCRIIEQGVDVPRESN